MLIPIERVEKLSLKMSHQLKVGLEIHTQLKTARKLFSLSHNNTSLLSTKPNSEVSFFDVSLPGTQPLLNPEVLFCALKCAVAMNCQVHPESRFDRKHYFYGDQPLGYQITQRYHALANDGWVKLTRRYDGLPEDRKIRIEQIQIEQDTGRSLYRLEEGTTDIDFNRSNIPLIEMVTKPDFSSIEQVRSFIKKYARMLQNLDVCTGELETGAIRVDVNVNVDEHPRVELKNIPTTPAIVSALRYEYTRQCKVIESGEKVADVETRGWDGKKTYRLRSKEDAIDYRYMPDPELPAIRLDTEDVLAGIKNTMPPTIEQQMDDLMENFELKLRDVNILMSNPKLLQYYVQLYAEVVGHLKLENPINWVVHDLLGCISKSELDFSSDILPVRQFATLLSLVADKTLTKRNAKLLLMHLVNNSGDRNKPLLDLVNAFNMNSKKESVSGDEASHVEEICSLVLKNNQNIVHDIIDKGKSSKINFLIGQCMRECHGKIDAQEFRVVLDKQLAAKI